jgi:hypothetical protein
MFKTLIILYALSFWVTAGRPKRGRSFPHWLAFMFLILLKALSWFRIVIGNEIDSDQDTNLNDAVPPTKQLRLFEGCQSHYSNS